MNIEKNNAKYEGKTMTEQQKIILNIYKDFKKICDKNKLKYFAIGGTCLGAIRHSGFIPWDDDLDVAMPIKDYLKFINIFEKNSNSGLELITPMGAPGRTQCFSKLTNVNTTYIEEEEKYNKNSWKGVFIDIMPISIIPENEKREKYINKTKVLRNMHFYRNQPLKCIRNPKIKIIWIITWPYLHIRKYNYYIKQLISLLNNTQSGNTVLFPWRKEEKALFDKKIFDKAIDHMFEDTTIKIPVLYDEYLKKEFGDYMQLPPKEMRVAAHNIYKEDLNKSYKYYLKQDNE